MNNKYNSFTHNHYGYTIPYVSTKNESLVLQKPSAVNMLEFQQDLEEALTLLAQVLAGETEKNMFYKWLIEQAPSKEDQQVLSGIRDDEIGHFGRFRQLYYELTGMVPPQPPSEQFIPPESYCTALSHAIQNQQNDVKIYHKILYTMIYPAHIKMVSEIIADENRHMSLYYYLYTKNNCSD